MTESSFFFDLANPLISILYLLMISKSVFYMPLIYILFHFEYRVHH